ncbi:MAG: LysR substrate-binding domain-containing protein [Candidatus Competibacteraceae bacterium]
MDTLIGMRAFSAVVSAGSFTAAADRLGLSKSLVSKYVLQLERRLGVRLLNRTTRHLSPTEVGLAYYDRCQSLLEAVDEMEAAILERQESPQGRLVVTWPQTFGELHLNKALAEFLERYPQVNVEVDLSDRFVNLLEEGFDLGIRICELTDTGLVARRLAAIRVVTCAAPSYLDQHGVPTHPLELHNHACVSDTNIDAAGRWPYWIDGERRNIEVKGRCRVNSTRAVRDLTIAGAGIGLCPDYAVADAVRDGRLRLLLQNYKSVEYGLYALYPHRRYLAAKVRAYVDFLIARFRGRLEWS